MENNNFFAQVHSLVDSLFLQTGFRLDQQLTGYTIADAVHVNIDPAMDAVVRTEHRINARLVVDLRELIDVTPPAGSPGQDPLDHGGENYFITFTAESAQFLGGNATAFGIHLTHIDPSSGEYESLDGGVFVTGTHVTDAYRLIVFLRTPAGDVSLARTGAVLGLDETGRLVAYQTFQFNQGLSITRHPPSNLSEADQQVMLYIFLTLTVFLMVNQGEASLHWQDEKTLVVG